MDRFGMTAATKCQHTMSSQLSQIIFVHCHLSTWNNCAPVNVGEVVCDLYDAYVRIICPVHDVTHMRKCTRPSPT